MEKLYRKQLKQNKKNIKKIINRQRFETRTYKSPQARELSQ